MVPIGRRWPCAEGFYWPGTLLLAVILWVFTFSFKSIYNCEDKRSIWRDLEYRKTYHKSVRTHIACDARTKQNVKHGRDLIAADVCTILIHVFEVSTERTLQTNPIIETIVLLFKKNRRPRACSNGQWAKPESHTDHFRSCASWHMILMRFQSG